MIAKFILLAGAGLYEHLLNDLVEGLAASDILALAVTEETSAYFYGNALIACSGKDRAGLAVAFPAEDLALPEAVLDLVPAPRLAPMQALIDTVEVGSIYLNSLAVEPAHGRLGLGRLLLETTAAMSEARGFAHMSLHVWTDNAPAMSLYRSLGFEVRELIDMPPSPSFTHRGPVAAVSAKIAHMLDQLASR